MPYLFMQAEDIFFVALGLQKISAAQRHLAFIYPDESQDFLRICHFCWHQRLENDRINDLSNTLVSPILLDPVNGLYLQAALDDISDINQLAIPYGFRTPIQSFDNENRYIGGTSGEGLTCATFVLEVLNKNGFHILDATTWKLSPEDKVWQQIIVEHLQSHNNVTSSHIESMRESIGKVVRFRPEQVYASGTVEPRHWKINFEDASKMAEAILFHLNLET